jgi:organic hydroperoxide reductase OsmC/OhrA
LHHEAHELCFIANSVNFAVKHEPEFKVAASPVR